MLLRQQICGKGKSCRVFIPGELMIDLYHPSLPGLPGRLQLMCALDRRIRGLIEREPELYGVLLHDNILMQQG